MTANKKKPKLRKIVTIYDMKKTRYGKLDESLDKEFNTQSIKIGFTNMVGEWRQKR